MNNDLSGRILIVDDEPAFGTVLSRILVGHHVIHAKNGREAMVHLKNERFDLVLCDLMMPEMNGIDVYQLVREFDADLAGRLVFMTGGAFTAEAQTFLKQIPNRCVEKPFNVELIQELLEAALRGDVGEQ